MKTLGQCGLVVSLIVLMGLLPAGAQEADQAEQAGEQAEHHRT